MCHPRPGNSHATSAALKQKGERPAIMAICFTQLKPEEIERNRRRRKKKQDEERRGGEK